MRPILNISMWVALTLLCSSCASITEKPVTSTQLLELTNISDANVTAEITKKEQESIKAEMSKDKVWFEKNLGDELVSTGPNGHPGTKARWIAHLMDPAEKFISQEIENMKVMTYGYTAVATYKWIQKQDKKGPDAVETIQYTDVWVKRNGDWQMVATHGSFVSDSK
ncbi:MAG: nuclear transport factor 2 family protein [Acidobacteria bacterium]|nr:nuclear transport factor 2 family protein [Acidobacteriota bacterium]